MERSRKDTRNGRLCFHGMCLPQISTFTFVAHRLLCAICLSHLFEFVSEKSMYLHSCSKRLRGILLPMYGTLRATSVDQCGGLQIPLPRNRRCWSLKALKMQHVHSLCNGYSGRKRGANRVAPGGVERAVTHNLKACYSLVKFEGRKRGCVACIQSGRRAKTGKC